MDFESCLVPLVTEWASCSGLCEDTLCQDTWHFDTLFLCHILRRLHQWRAVDSDFVAEGADFLGGHPTQSLVAAEFGFAGDPPSSDHQPALGGSSRRTAADSAGARRGT
jgi:hypothetical protein